MKMMSQQEMWTDLAFLMVYVPARLLMYRQGYDTIRTWEQNFERRASQVPGAFRYGVTAIQADNLLDDNEQWKRPDRLRWNGEERFGLSEVSLTELILDMCSCTKGVQRMREELPA